MVFWHLLFRFRLEISGSVFHHYSLFLKSFKPKISKKKQENIFFLAFAPLCIQLHMLSVANTPTNTEAASYGIIHTAPKICACWLAESNAVLSKSRSKTLKSSAKLWNRMRNLKSRSSWLSVSVWFLLLSSFEQAETQSVPFLQQILMFLSTLGDQIFVTEFQFCWTMPSASNNLKITNHTYYVCAILLDFKK